MSLARVTAPAMPPLELAEVKVHLRVTSYDDDNLITGLIDAVREHLEGKDGILGRALVTQTWDYWIDCFPSDCHPIQIPLSPLQSITFIKYIDDNGAQQTLSASAYSVDDKSTPSRIVPAYGYSWPSARGQLNAVQIRGVFGYGLETKHVPASIRHAMLLMIGHLYQNREALNIGNIVNELPMGVDALLAPYRVRRF